MKTKQQLDEMVGRWPGGQFDSFRDDYYTTQAAVIGAIRFLENPRCNSFDTRVAIDLLKKVAWGYSIEET